MDMQDLRFPPSLRFSVILDKCSMDALTTAEGSPWRPNSATRQAVHRLLSGVSARLQAGGRYIQISFSQVRH